jgi:hypothetical protein
MNTQALSQPFPSPGTSSATPALEPPSDVPADRLLFALRMAAWASAVCVALMLALSWSSGLNVQHFEVVASPAAWSAALLAHASALRGITVIDDVFIACYLSVSLLLVHALRTRAAPGDLPHVLGPWVLGLGGLTGLLDIVENHHVLSLLHAASVGLPLSADALVSREVLSSAKWMLGHVAFVLVGVAIGFRSLPWRAFRWVLIGVQLPVGAAALALAGTPMGEWLGWCKLLNVMGGFLLLAVLPWPRASGSGAPA